MKYKALLVDDEKFMISYLKDCIDWAALYIEVVDDAYDGIEAIEKTKKYNPDIVISDIVMPSMSGLEFIKNIHTQYKSVRIIILSGHENFMFAKEALSYGVVDYIIKPSKISDITEALKKAIASIEEERMRNENYNGILEKLDKSLSDIQNTFILSLINKEKASREQLLEKAKCISLDLLHKNFLGIVLKANPYTEKGINSMGSDKICSEVVSEFKSTMLKPKFVFSNSINEMVYCLLPFDNSIPYSSAISMVNKAFNNVIQRIYVSSFEGVFVGIGLPCDDITNANVSFEQAMSALDNRICSQNRQVVCYKNMFEHIDTTIFNYEAGTEIKNAIKLNDSDKFDKIIEDMIVVAIQSNVTMFQFKRDMGKVLNILESLLFSENTDLESIAREYGLKDGDVLKSGNVKSLQRSLKELGRCVMEYLNSNGLNKYPRIIKLITQYLKEHYNKNFTVINLSQKFYLTPNYLSNIFKKHTGQNISEYVTKLRIDKARQLLEGKNDIKAYEVATIVGYSDYEYFRRVFKKYAGINPTKYKNNI